MYLVVGYKTEPRVSSPTVLLYGAYDTIQAARNRQVDLSGVSIPILGHTSVMYGRHMTWLKELQMGSDIGCNILTSFAEPTERTESTMQTAHLATLTRNALQEMKRLHLRHCDWFFIGLKDALCNAANNGLLSVGYQYDTDETSQHIRLATGRTKYDRDTSRIRDDAQFHDMVIQGLKMSDKSIVEVTIVDVTNAPPTRVTVFVTWKDDEVDTNSHDKGNHRISNVQHSCPICMEETPANILVPCGHHVCVGCAETSRSTTLTNTTSHTCPTCRMSVWLTQPVFT